ncbi:MAG: hypothetical protein ACJATF_003601, partial [Flavobacteriales bacterium]
MVKTKTKTKTKLTGTAQKALRFFKQKQINVANLYGKKKVGGTLPPKT